MGDFFFLNGLFTLLHVGLEFLCEIVSLKVWNISTCVCFVCVRVTDKQ